MNNTIVMSLKDGHILISDVLRGGTLKIIDLTPGLEDCNPLVELINNLEEKLNESAQLLFNLEGESEITFKDCRPPIFYGMVTLKNVYGPIRAITSSEIIDVDFRPAELNGITFRYCVIHRAPQLDEEKNQHLFMHHAPKFVQR